MQKGGLLLEKKTRDWWRIRRKMGKQTIMKCVYSEGKNPLDKFLFTAVYVDGQYRVSKMKGTLTS
jgi:hypothetical protein